MSEAGPAKWLQGAAEEPRYGCRVRWRGGEGRTSGTRPSLPRPNPAEFNVHRWGSNAAEMAYILFQTPVMVAVHASEMLENANA